MEEEKKKLLHGESYWPNNNRVYNIINVLNTKLNYHIKEK